MNRVLNLVNDVYIVDICLRQRCIRVMCFVQPRLILCVMAGHLKIDGGRVKSLVLTICDGYFRYCQCSSCLGSHLGHHT